MIDFEAMMGSSPNPYMVLDRQFRLVWANRAYERATMRGLAEIEGKTLFDAFPPQDEESGAQLLGSIQRAFDTGEVDELAFIEYAIQAPDGSMQRAFWSATHTPFADETGHVAYVLQHTVDITELETLRRERDEIGVVSRARAAERRYNAATQEVVRLRSVIEQAPGFMAVLAGPEHRYLFANAAYRRLLGERAFIGRTVAEAVPEVAEQGFVAILDRVFSSGEPYFGQREKVVFVDEGSPDARQTYLEFIFQPFRGARGEISGIFIQGHDVTEEVEAEERQRLLINELNHRVKNTLAVVQGLAQQTFGTDSGGRYTVFSARLGALAGAHSLLTEATWESADLRDLVLSSLEATAGIDVRRCSVEGPKATLPPQLAVTLAMIVHELSTNAIKYGALSNDAGTVAVSWTTQRKDDACQLSLNWTEAGGPPVSEPERRGFGARLISRGLIGQGQAALEFRPEGLHCRIEASW